MGWIAWRRRGRTGAGLAAILVAGSPARAIDCANPTTQMDMNECSGADLVRADATLNAAYGRLVREPSMVDRLDRLKAAERAWVAYRDAQCAFEGSEVEGGTMHSMVVSGCARALTERRTGELKAALACAQSSDKC